MGFSVVGLLRRVLGLVKRRKSRGREESRLLLKFKEKADEVKIVRIYSES